MVLLLLLNLAISLAAHAVCDACFFRVTVGEDAWRGELRVGQSSQVVKYCAAVTSPLGVIHKGPNVLLLAMVTDSWADHHGNITWDTQTKKQER